MCDMTTILLASWQVVKETDRKTDRQKVAIADTTVTIRVEKRRKKKKMYI